MIHKEQHIIQFQKRKSPIISALIALFFFIPIISGAQQAYSIKNFNTSNGLTQNTISGMAFDSTGYLWMTVSNGIIRYDGFNFKLYFPDTASSNLNISNQVLTIFTVEKKIFVRTKNGWLYTVHEGRPVVYDNTVNNTLFTYDLRGHFPNTELLKKFNLPQDVLTNQYDWDANTREILPVNNNDFIALSNNKSVLFYYKNGTRQYDIKLTGSFSFFLKTSTGNLMGDANNNIFLYDDNVKKFVEIKTPIDSLRIITGNIDKPVYFWDMYNDESYCFYNSTFYQVQVDIITMSLRFSPLFTVEKSNYAYTGILYDPLNSIYYLRTLKDGLFQVKLKQIRTFQPAKEFGTNRNAMEMINYSILKTSDSTALTTNGFELTSNTSGIHVHKKGNIYSNRETIAKLGDSAILCADATQLYYYKLKESFVNRHSFNDSFNTNNPAYITLLYPEADSVWVGTNQSICLLTNKKTSVIMRRAKDSKSIFFGIKLFHRIAKDAAFISNDFGFYKLKTSEPYRIDTFPQLAGKQVRHISVYKDTLLLSVYKDGLYVFTGGRFFKVPQRQDQGDLKFCHSTYIDKNGNVWITTDKGLFRTAVSAIIQSVNENGNSPFFFYYGEAEGIKNIEFNGAGTPPYVSLADGQLFYPSMAGIVTFNPSRLMDTLSHSTIFIEKIEVGNNAQTYFTDSISLDANFKYLNITLAVPHFSEPVNLLLEYKLDNNGWNKIPVFPVQSFSVYNLSPGYHQLMIRKRTGLGNNDYVYKILSVFRRKNIHEHWWFYPAIILVFVLLALLLVERQTRHVAAKKLALQKLVEAQTAELFKTMETKELLINIISHDMVTPLRHISLIAGFLEKGLEKNPGKITAALSDIETTSERILHGSMDIVSYMKYNTGRITINKKDINVYSMVQAVCDIFEPIAANRDMQIVNSVSRSIFAEVDDIIFGIILNNIISNAIKYGKRGTVEIFAETDNETITILRVKDTGAGMDKDNLSVIQGILQGNIQVEKAINKASTGLGYMLIAELAAIHDLIVHVDSEIDEGTTVSIFIN